MNPSFDEARTRSQNRTAGDRCGEAFGSVEREGVQNVWVGENQQFFSISEAPKGFYHTWALIGTKNAWSFWFPICLWHDPSTRVFHKNDLTILLPSIIRKIMGFLFLKNKFSMIYGIHGLFLPSPRILKSAFTGGLEQFQELLRSSLRLQGFAKPLLQKRLRASVFWVPAARLEKGEKSIEKSSKRAK